MRNAAVGACCRRSASGLQPLVALQLELVGQVEVIAARRSLTNPLKQARRQLQLPSLPTSRWL